uniref:60S ribosomal protein L8-3 n=1 Tax=Rhizophora mucronata TaxID=61149 RepID=A0A2P2MDN4_RHIMU
MEEQLSLSTLIRLGSSCSSLSSKTTSPPCSNETNLLARRGITPDRACMSNVLVITSSMRMLNWVHCHTTYLGPAIPLHSVLVVGITSLQQGLFSPTSTCNLSYHCTATTWNNLL